ncbi:ABC transporter permease [Chloroflexota bacterium]
MVIISNMHRKLFRDLKTAKVQFGAVILIVLLGVALFIGAYGAYLNLDTSYNTSYDILEMANYWISVDYIDERAAREMDEIPGATAQGRIIGEVFIDMRSESGEQVVGRIISLPPHEHPILNNVSIISGSYFTPYSGREILLENHFADYYKLQPGDWLTLEREESKGRFMIAGIVTSPEYIWVSKSAQEPMPSPRNFGVLFMPQPTAEKLFNMDGLVNEINLAVAPGVNHDKIIDEVRQILRRHNIKRMTTKDEPLLIRTREIDIIKGVRTAYMVKRDDLIGNRLLKQDLEGFAQLAFLFPVLFLSMASLAIYVLLSRLIESQRVQIGLMLALGYSKAKILFHYLGFSLVVGIIGSILGAGLGHVLGSSLTSEYTAQLNIPISIIKIHWDIIVTGMLIGVIMPLIAGLPPAWSTMKMKPAAAMRPAPPQTGHRTLPEIVLPFLSRLPYLFLLPMRNVFRNIRRSLFMAVGVASAVILVLVSMSFVDAMDKALNTQYEVIQKYDALILFQGTGASSTAAYVGRLDGIDQAEAILEMPYRIRHGEHTADSSIMGLPKQSSMYNLLSPEGDFLDVVDDSILVPVAFKEKLDVDINDIVQLEPLVGTLGDTEKRLAGFVDTPIGGRAFMPIREVQQMLHSPGTATGILVTFNGQPSPDLLKKLYNLPKVASIEFIADTIGLLDEMMGFFWVFIGVMLVMGAALGAAIVFNNVTVNVLQRTREIAIMRAVGISNTRLTAILTLENLTIGIIGILIGIPVGIYIADYFFQSMASSTDDVISITLTIFPRTYIISTVSALVILLVSQIPAIRKITTLSLATATKDWAE